jgi:hypothetical protein
MSNPRIEVDFAVNVAGVASGVSAATSQLDKLGAAAQSTAPKVDQLAKATSRYNGIGLDFARVIQDAPFGIIGVGNNIQQLSQSFSALGSVGDSISTKLKAAFSAIFSSGNLLVLGVSVITAALTYYEKNAQKAESASKSLNDELEKYRENLDGIAKANLEGIKNAQSEIANFKLLQSQAENTNISYEKRIEAVEKLKKQYPDYLKNLTNEQILTGNVGTAYDNLTASIIATAKAKAFQSQIGANALNQATLAAQIEENLVKIKELQIEKADVLAASEKQSARDKQDFLIRANAIQGNINDLEKQNIENKKESNKLDEQNNKLAEEINKKVSQGADFVNDTGKGIDANKEKLKKYSAEWDEYNLRQESANFLADKYSLSQKDLEKNIRSVLTAIPKEPVRIVSDDEALQAYNDELFKTQQAAYQASIELMRGSDSAFKFSDNLDKISGKEVKINMKVEGAGDETADQLPFIQQLETALNPKKFTEFEERIADFAFNVRDLLQNNLTNAFVDLGYTIGESLASGANVIQEVGKSLLKSFGRFLGQFGEQLIAYGVATIAFGKASIGLSNPFTAIPSGGLAIAAGVALTAISGVIGALGKKGPGGGGGGGGAGGGAAAPAGSSFTGGGVGGLFAQNRDLNGELVVRGQDLVYVFNQANDRINKG